jgi:peptidoglycan hydrolase-like protein with peptidoglycan-binding domain
MKGEEVKMLQEALNKLSYNVGTADGVFGSITEIALKSFQSSNGLKVTGITDVDTIKKLIGKNLDLIVANDVTMDGAGFAVDTNVVTIISKNGDIDQLPQMSKRDVAAVIIDKIVDIYK